MADNYLHDESGVDYFLGEVKNHLDDYNEHICALETLLNTISSSSAWQDESVKTAFINTVTSFVRGYKVFSSGIDGYIECLRLKSTNLSEHESNFS